MSNHFFHLLKRWHDNRGDCQWVLGSVYQTEGSAYRKAGAFMLFNDRGQKFGLLSGGCLEADLHRKAMLALTTDTAQTVRYDSAEEGDLSYQFGLGCGGVVNILLQPVTAANNFLDLPLLLTQLQRREAATYWQLVPTDNSSSAVALSKKPAASSNAAPWRGELVQEQELTWLVTPMQAPPHLLVIGGGIDAQPLVAMAALLGWEVTVADPRPANARAEHFSRASRIIRQPLNTLAEGDWAASVSAAVVMSHDSQLDAEGLQAVVSLPLSYCALLGPDHRRRQVLGLAQLDDQQLPCPLAGPAGLDLGADLPESIALAIIAECHAVLCKHSGASLSHIL